MSTAKPLEQIIKDLPPEARHELEDFAYFLRERYIPKAKQLKVKPLGFSWVGALKDLRDKFTSVELQHHIQDLWEENVSPRHEHPLRTPSGSGKGG